MTEQPDQRGLSRWLWLGIGLFNLGLAFLGTLLPLMPTTIFLIFAAGAFARSSPRLEAFVLNHSVFGPMVRDWRQRKAIPPRAKMMAIGGMVGGYVAFCLSARPDWPLVLGVAAAISACGTYVLTRPS